MEKEGFCSALESKAQSQVSWEKDGLHKFHYMSYPHDKLEKINSNEESKIPDQIPLIVAHSQIQGSQHLHPR